MHGRLIPCETVNEHGIPYARLLQAERQTNGRLIKKCRQTLQLWLAAMESSPTSKGRKELRQKALEQTRKVLQ